MFEFLCLDTTNDNANGLLVVLKTALVNGTYSDIKIQAFESTYNLHKVVLTGSGFFKRAMQWAEDDSNSELTGLIKSSEIVFSDNGFSKEAFELCIAVLYGYQVEELIKQHAIDVMIVAQYLDMPDLVDYCIDWVVKDVSLDTVGEILPFSLDHNYQRLTDTCVALLAMNGYQAGVEIWAAVPVSIIANVMKSNWFFVPSEWHRCMFLIEIIKLHNNNKVLVDVLNNDIMYCHFSHDQLFSLGNLTHLIDHTTLKSALWQSVQLQHHILCGKDYLSQHNWHIPSKDETLSGLVPDLTYSENPITTNIPPFRFSVAFSDVSSLPANKRIYSKTFWYLGSYWNVYLQKSQLVLTGQYQIGIYLHRANHTTVNALQQDAIMDDDSFVTGFNCGANSSKNGIQNKDIFDISSNEDSNLEQKLMNLKLNDSKKLSIPYEDKREQLGVYFSFYTPSRINKPEITSFFSVPNKFSMNQSWGWKSNNLCQFDSFGHFLPNDDELLKFIIVLGQ